MIKDYVWTFRTAPVADPKVIAKVVVISKFVMLGDTHFKIDSAEFSPAAEDILDQNTKIMRDNPDLKVRIAGYASASGTKEYNQDLSERRAAAVVAYMVDKGGVAANRFDIIGYGETRPAIYEDKPGNTHSDAAKANMRVLFEVIV
jgi:OOP family OmpA-OmpF porin